MAVIVDLDDSVAPDPHADPHSNHHHDVEGGPHAFAALSKHSIRETALAIRSGRRELEDGDAAATGEAVNRANPNVNGFSAMLSCYPAVESLASLLDLNSLHDLALTCRQFRANLLSHRNPIVKHTLRCANDEAPLAEERSKRFREYVTTPGYNYISSAGYGGRMLSGKVGACARDMVGECRSCSTVICRNCVTKPPPGPALEGRFRRLCQVCVKAPLSALYEPIHDHEHSLHSSTSHSPSHSPSSSPQTFEEPDQEPAFTAEAFLRGPCCCEDMVWLCGKCGSSLKSNDIAHQRCWAWRKRYSTDISFGTTRGFEGDEGVHCGREEHCLAARYVQREIDVPSSEFEKLHRSRSNGSSSGRSWDGGSFDIQEYVAPGGSVMYKKKVSVRIGAVVKEYEDERYGHREYLDREMRGERRGFCAWCKRVIPSKKGRTD